MGCVFSLTLAISLIVRYYVKNIFKKRHAFNDTSLVGLRNDDNNSLGTLTCTFESTLPNRIPLSKIEPIFKPMITEQNNDLKIIKRTGVYPINKLSNPVYTDVADAGNDDLITDVYITNQKQPFNGPNYDSSGIKPVKISNKTWEQLQIEKSFK